MWPECSNDIPKMEALPVKQPGVGEMNMELLDILNKCRAMANRIAVVIYKGDSDMKCSEENDRRPCCIAENGEMNLGMAKAIESTLADIINHL